jgi:excinuclease UvrABC nuclease subunit
MKGLPDSLLTYRPIGPCVYFLFQGGELVYIGKASNLAVRVAGHRQKNKFAFNEVRYLSLLKGENIRQVEADWVYRLQPKHNVRLKAGNPLGEWITLDSEDRQRLRFYMEQMGMVNESMALNWLIKSEAARLGHKPG